MVKVVYGKKSTLQQEVKLEVEADVDSLNDLRRALGVRNAVARNRTWDLGIRSLLW